MTWFAARLRPYRTELQFTLAVSSGLLSAVGFADFFEDGEWWSLAVGCGAAVALVAAFWPVYTRLKDLERLIGGRDRHRQILDGLGAYVVEGQQLEGWLIGIPDPSPQHRDWVNRAETFIQNTLGLYYVAIFRSSSGLNEPPTTGFSTEQQKFVYVDTEWRLQRLHEIMHELNSEVQAIDRATARR